MASPVRSRIVANGMLRINTPVHNYVNQYGMWVKREDLSCPKPGPGFSKSRGVYARILSRPETVIGVLDTYHSQAGHAVARACQILGKKCLDFYPEFKYEPGPRQPQLKAKELGATLIGLPAGRSAILYHQARKKAEGLGAYMMPNALKLEESVVETAKEVTPELIDIVFDRVIIPSSSATIASGVIKGFLDAGVTPRFIIHLGYSRSHEEVRRYVENMAGYDNLDVEIVDEGYAYKDRAKEGPSPEWPCNEYYDLKAFRWWMGLGAKKREGKTLFWNVG